MSKMIPIYDLPADISFEGVNPKEWRDSPDPGSDNDDDTDSPTDKGVVAALGFDPDTLEDEWLDEIPLSRISFRDGLARGVSNVFCPTGAGGGVDPSCGKESSSKVLTKAPCCPSVLRPNSNSARVGVPGDSAPPPPQDGIPRLPNLTEKQRAVETRFAEAYLANPDKLVAKYEKALRKGKVGVASNVYATDDVKMLNPDWNPAEVRAGEKVPKESLKAMAKYNTAVHQTANAIAKRAFLNKLDELEELSDDHPLKSVLVTNGGVAAGKGSTLSHADEPDSPYNKLLPTANQVGVVWDAAGEQNSTENEWIHRECEARGIKPTFAYVWAEPLPGSHGEGTWDAEDRGVIRRAERKGRMVDARLFADSYAEGAKNMHAFVQDHKDDGTDFIFIDNRVKGSPKVLDAFPKQTLKWNSEKIYAHAVKSLRAKAASGDLSKSLAKAGLAGTIIWGPPHEE